MFIQKFKKNLEQTLIQGFDLPKALINEPKSIGHRDVQTITAAQKSHYAHVLPLPLAKVP